MYWLDHQIAFPDPVFADDNGLLAAGGDLSPERLVFAYQNGIFPWYNEGEPILWWSPNPRFVMRPEELKVSKSMRQVLRKNTFRISYDTVFDQVIEACSSVTRQGQNGTWLVPEMKEAYIRLHQLGLAHSAEAWVGTELVGGLYGVCLGKVFYGESMFAKQSNASKAAFVTLVQQLQRWGFELIDCQTHTSHLESLGANFITREDFLSRLKRNNKQPVIQELWTKL